ncbi:hypothetical protein BJ170DRAFT_600012 [Xylariales sp. AK1849]|nr:hypothetical protein BJ170DRAFT_600012 [Xylariales sp. AK1849]
MDSGNIADVPALEEYRYMELKDDNSDTRLITLMPGKAQDPITVTIQHTSLVVEADKPWNDGLRSQEELEKTLSQEGERSLRPWTDDIYSPPRPDLNAGAPDLTAEIIVEGSPLLVPVTETVEARARLPVTQNLHEALVHLRNICSRPWFSRLWVVQEAQLAKPRNAIFQCGRCGIQWASFCVASSCLAYNHQVSLSVQGGACQALSNCANLQDLPSRQVLWSMRYKSCSDERDRIYAVLGLLPDGLSSRIQPQYSLAIADVFRNAFLEIMKFSNKLDMLGLCCLSGRHIDEPSWIPDFACRLPVEGPMIEQSCSGLSAASALYEQPSVLIVQAIESSPILRVCQPFERGHEKLADVGQFVLPWMAETLPRTEACEEMGSQEHYVEVLVQKCVQNRWLGYPSLQQWKVSMFQPENGDERIGEEELSTPDPTVPASLMSRSARLSKSPLRLYAHARIDDVVFTVLGCATPMLLRPSKGGTFKAVGQCFVTSLCDSLSLLGPLPESWMVQCKRDKENRLRYYYVNLFTEEQTFNDPRLGPLEDWEILDDVPVGQDSVNVAVFRNRKTGITRNSDPRLDVDALKRRGVPVKAVRLV